MRLRLRLRSFQQEIVFSLSLKVKFHELRDNYGMSLARVLIIEDDLFTRTTLAAALTSHGINVIGATDIAKAALEIVRNNSVDVCVVDLDLGPGPSGVDLCNAIRGIKESMGLVMLTSFVDPRLHDPNQSNLPKGCRFISKGNIDNIDQLVNEILVARHQPLKTFKIKNQESSKLTNNQIEILKMVSAGLSSSQIAENRGVSVKAVEATISKIHSILGISKSKSLNKRVQIARKYFALAGKKPPGD